jgi:hypothetical protein
MKNLLSQEDAQAIVSKASNIYGSRFGSTLANVINVPPVYVSKVKKFASSGDVTDLPSKNCFAKFLAFLGSSNKEAPIKPANNPSNSAEYGLVVTLKNKKTNRFESGVSVSDADLKEHYNGDLGSDSALTDAEILNEIQTNFNIVRRSVSSMFSENGCVSGLVVSGPAGCGKSFNIEQQIKEEAVKADIDFKVTHLKGANMSYTGLYSLLFKHRNGGVIVFDDSDKLWEDSDMLNTFKAAMDTSSKRFLSNASGGRWVQDLADSEGVELEDVREFEFKAKIIFITNKDIGVHVEAKKKNHEHFAAIIDRSLYIDLEMFSLRAKYLWCEYVFMDFIAPQLGFSDDLTLEVMEYVSDNRYNLRDVSVRGIEMIAKFAADPEFKDGAWKTLIRKTKFKKNR